MDYRTNMSCALKVDTQSGGWEKYLTKMLKKIKGAKYNLDAEGGMLYVSGKVNPTKVLKKLKKAGKAAEIVWVSTGGAAYSYYEDPTSSYNYYNNNTYMNNDYMNNGYGLGLGYYPTAPSYGHHHHHHHQLPMTQLYPYGGHGYGGYY